MNSPPRVQIGLPVYNGATTVERALESLLAQEHADFEILVSDNASTDGTADVLAAIAARDPRVRVHRQPRNIGAHANFGWLLAQARSPYFLWAAADDRWEPDFVASTLAFLDSHPDYVSCITRVRFEDDAGRFGDAMGTFPLRGSVHDNLRAYLWQPQFNSRFYGLHRTEALQSCWFDVAFWGGDWALMAKLICLGKFQELPRVGMTRSARGASSDWARTLSAWKAGALTQVFPMHEFVRFVGAMPEVRDSAVLKAIVLNWELRGAAMLLKYRMASLLRR